MAEKVTTLDSLNILRFARKDTSDNIDLSSHNKTNPGLIASTQMVPVGAYEFSWGRVEEYDMKMLILWDLHFNSFQTLNGKERKHSQQQLFSKIEDTYPRYCENDVKLATGLQGGWCIYPSTGDSALSIFTTWDRRIEARSWVAEELLSQFIPRYTSV